MDPAGQATALRFDLNRDSPFFFKCQVCSVCCSNKSIQVGPYEALRLSRRLGVSTTEFFRLYAEEGGSVLRNKPDGSCIFLNTRGCGVHPDRPLVCRLFPLGLLQDEQGASRFGVMPLHPDCIGLIDTDGTVEGYLESQGAIPYFRYEKAYKSVKRKIVERWPRRWPAGKFHTDAAGPEKLQEAAFAPGGPFSLWLDVDLSLAACGRPKGSGKPENLDELVQLHIQGLEEWIAGL